VLHFSSSRISASSNVNPILSSKKTIYEQQSEIFEIRYCEVALLKALTTYTIHGGTETYKNIQIKILLHLRINALILKIMILLCTSSSDVIYANMKSAESGRSHAPAPVGGRRAWLGIAIPDFFSNPGIPGLNPGIESLILN